MPEVFGVRGSNTDNTTRSPNPTNSRHGLRLGPGPLLNRRPVLCPPPPLFQPRRPTLEPRHLPAGGRSG